MREKSIIRDSFFTCKFIKEIIADLKGELKGMKGFCPEVLKKQWSSQDCQGRLYGCSKMRDKKRTESKIFLN